MRSYIISIMFMMMFSCKRGSSFSRAISPPRKTILRAEGRKSPTTHHQVVSKVATSPDGGLVVEPGKGEFCTADEILEPKGKHYPWYSLGPFKEGMKWAATPGPYFKNMTVQNNNDPVFKIHPGLAAIAITDHASGKWFFDQPDTVLDRQGGAYFGAMKCSRDYLGDSLPALVTNLKEAHPAVREYMLTIVRERLGSAETAILHAADKFYSDKRTNGVRLQSTVEF